MPEPWPSVEAPLPERPARDADDWDWDCEEENTMTNTNAVDRERLANVLYRMNGHAWYGRDLGDWDNPESRIGRNSAERDRWYRQADALLVVERSPRIDRVDADLMGRAAARLREVLPSFTDPRHYANHADIALVRDLEARVIPPGHHPRCTGQHETIMGETACVLPPAKGERP